jgi:hypothetical protein
MVTYTKDNPWDDFLDDLPITEHETLISQKGIPNTAKAAFSQTKAITVSIDSEFTDSHFLSLQIYIESWDLKIFVINTCLIDYYPTRKKEYFKIQTEAAEMVDFVFCKDLDDHYVSALHEVLIEICKLRGEEMPKVVYTLLFFSFFDVYAAFGWDESMFYRSRNQSQLDWLERKRAMSGQLFRDNTKYEIKDVKGLGSGGLTEFAQSLGFVMENKSALDLFKNNKMHIAMLSRHASRRKLFIRYGMDDCVILPKLLNRFTEAMQEICKHELKFPEHLIPENFPMTIGSVVSKIFEQFIFIYVTERCKVNELLYLKAIYKVGFLGSKNRPTFFRSDSDKRDLVSERDEIYNKNNQDEKLIRNHCNKYIYSYDAISLASIPFVKTLDLKKKVRTSSFVPGGRCVAERFREIVHYNLVDIDIASAYGAGLARFGYPIGTPYYYLVSVNKRGMSLRDFLSKFKKELVPGFWTISITHKNLGFCQDLIYSKCMTNMAENTEIGEPSDHVLLKREILNGVLTANLLDIINRVATNAEKKSFFNAEVTSAIIYLKSKKIETPEDWCHKVLDKNVDAENNTYWFCFSLDEFVRPLLNKRAEIKKSMKIESKPELKLQLFGKQTALKLLCNCLYGTISSKYFRIGNLCVGNQVTASCRASSWVLGKALNPISTVTDGFFYQPLNVNKLNTEAKSFRRPGLHYFSSPYRLAKHDHIKRVKLLNANWTDKKALNYIGNFSNDKLVQITMNHLLNFWEPYKLKILFEIEYKMESIAVRGVFYSKASNAIEKLDGTITYKTRGYQESQNGVMNPLCVMMSYIMQGRLDFLPENRKFAERVHISPELYRQEKKANPAYPYRPGNIILVARYFKLNVQQFEMLWLNDHRRMLSITRKNKSFEMLEKKAGLSPANYLYLGERAIKGHIAVID